MSRHSLGSQVKWRATEESSPIRLEEGAYYFAGIQGMRNGGFAEMGHRYAAERLLWNATYK